MSEGTHPISLPPKSVPPRRPWKRLLLPAGSQVVLPLEPRLDVFRRVLVTHVRQDAHDLTARQLAILLTVYGEKKEVTVNQLATTLNVLSSSVTHAMDRIVRLDLIDRQRDVEDRRRVYAKRTKAGYLFYATMLSIINAAADETRREVRRRR